MELAQEIVREARRQLAADGPRGLSLRAIARELGMASSALYRYFPSRDELLVALASEAYGSLSSQLKRAVGTAVAEGDGEAGGSARDRWRALCAAVRDWAHECPEEYALVFGTPLPGSPVPMDWMPLSMAGILSEASCQGNRSRAAAAPRPLPERLEARLAGIAAETTPELSTALLAQGLSAWTRLLGLVSFELYGRTAASIDPDGEFFAYSVEEMADSLGLSAKL